MENKQSSIDWYENKLIQLDIDFGGHKNYWVERKKLRDQAKAMHKEEIENAFVIRPYTNFARKNKYNSGFEQYYNETFGGGE